MAQPQADSQLNLDLEKIVSILSYLTILGWLIGLLIYGNHRSGTAKFHLKQGLGLILTAAVLSFVPLVGWVLNILVIVYWCISLYKAAFGQIYLVPVLGNYYQQHLNFIK